MANCGSKCRTFLTPGFVGFTLHVRPDREGAMCSCHYDGEYTVPTTGIGEGTVRTYVELSAPGEDACPSGIEPSRMECQSAALTFQSPSGKPLQPFREISLANLPCGCIFYEGVEEDSISFNSHENCSSESAYLEEDLYTTPPYAGSRCSQTATTFKIYDFFYKNSVISDWEAEDKFETCGAFCHPYTKLPGYVGFATEKNAVNRCMCFFDSGKLPAPNPVSNGAWPSTPGMGIAGPVNSGRPNSIGDCYPYQFYNTRSVCKPAPSDIICYKYNNVEVSLNLAVFMSS